jgi:hypothetical protein
LRRGQTLSPRETTFSGNRESERATNAELESASISESGEKDNKLMPNIIQKGEKQAQNFVRVKKIFFGVGGKNRPQKSWVVGEPLWLSPNL